MRNISFALTTEQIRTQTKTVTRRLGWQFLKAGDFLQPIVKGQGIPKGARVEKIGRPVRVESVRRERLDAITADDVRLEGFSGLLPGTTRRWTPVEFVNFFCESHQCQPWDSVTRIEFTYTQPVCRPADRIQRDALKALAGPWRVGPHYKTDVESRFGRVCECGPFGSPQAEANARAIATLPDVQARVAELESVLKSIIIGFDGEDDDQHDQALTKARALLGFRLTENRRG